MSETGRRGRRRELGFVDYLRCGGTYSSVFVIDKTLSLGTVGIGVGAIGGASGVGKGVPLTITPSSNEHCLDALVRTGTWTDRDLV